ncbi:hypothetical protein FISHEDRAFT_58296 [Fistulina hepatica ATCC 64428]|nr:hypothetical protein FISHEDRAFT_58296 [Fistulina hepatica ATCC 64428]
MTNDAADNDIDTDALQAQIDLSMALASDLVSSWIKPTSKLVQKSRTSTTDVDLKEYMRRPPRLGVGASVPEGSSATLARDGAKLKQTIVGRKSAEQKDFKRGTDAVEEEEEERKGGDLQPRKKAKYDPFDMQSYKKDKKKAQATPAADEDVVARSLTQTSPPAPFPNHSNGKDFSSTEYKTFLNKQKTAALSDIPSQPSSPSRATNNADVDSPISSVGCSTTQSTPKKEKPPSSTAVLNLDRPPADQAADNGTDGSLKAKKRRKRKKRKKHGVHGTTGDGPGAGGDA